MPPLRGHLLAVALVRLVLLTLVNLRGVKASGPLFAVPTYLHVTAMGLLIVVGLVRLATGSLEPLPPNQAELDHFTQNGALIGTVTAFPLARAFASGAVALSGVEVISNGVQAFKEPQTRNAATTLAWTGAILAVLFGGIALLASRLTPTLSEHETILSVMGRAVFRGSNPLYYPLQAGTAIILIFSANSAFAGFPRLVSVVARDGYLPRQLANRGDRLVYSNGSLGLALPSGALLVGFGAVTTWLVPLFAVGLFLALHRGVPQAVAYAQSMQPRHLVAVTVELEPGSADHIEADWAALGMGVPLEVVRSPYRELTRPLLDYIDELDERWDDDVITVVVPEFLVLASGSRRCTTRARSP